MLLQLYDWLSRKMIRVPSITAFPHIFAGQETATDVRYRVRADTIQILEVVQFANSLSNGVM